MFEILFRDWNLKSMYIQKWAYLHVNWGLNPPTSLAIPTLYQHDHDALTAYVVCIPYAYQPWILNGMHGINNKEVNRMWPGRVGVEWKLRRPGGLALCIRRLQCVKIMRLLRTRVFDVLRRVCLGRFTVVDWTAWYVLWLYCIDWAHHHSIQTQFVANILAALRSILHRTFMLTRVCTVHGWEMLGYAVLTSNSNMLVLQINYVCRLDVLKTAECLSVVCLHSATNRLLLWCCCLPDVIIA